MLDFNTAKILKESTGQTTHFKTSEITITHSSYIIISSTFNNNISNTLNIYINGNLVKSVPVMGRNPDVFWMEVNSNDVVYVDSVTGSGVTEIITKIWYDWFKIKTKF